MGAFADAPPELDRQREVVLVPAISELCVIRPQS